MIVVRLRNGLGNQMFQYALGRNLSIRYGRELCLETSLLKKAGVVPREYGLGVFPISSRLVSAEEVSRIVEEQGAYAVVSQSWRGYHASAGCAPHATLTVYDGLWQSERYFSDIGSTIRNDFACGEADLEPTKRQMYQTIREGESICVHVRRTDYLLRHYSMRFTGLSYYVKALATIDERVRSPHFYIFSDDLAWCKKNLALEGRAHTFVEELGWPQFILMTGCKHFLIANSTFSWWAAWLATCPEKIVVAPPNWFHDDEAASRDIIPDAWLRCQSLPE